MTEIDLTYCLADLASLARLAGWRRRHTDAYGTFAFPLVVVVVRTGHHCDSIGRLVLFQLSPTERGAVLARGLWCEYLVNMAALPGRSEAGDRRAMAQDREK